MGHPRDHANTSLEKPSHQPLNIGAAIHNEGDGMLVKFEVYKDGRHWCARGIGVDIFTQGKNLDDLMRNVREAVAVHFEDELKRGEEVKILSISEMEVGAIA